jgi:hypothetical protein
LWRNVTRALAATGVFVVAILLLFWLRRRVDSFLVARLDARIKSVETQSFKVMPAERIWEAVRNALTAIRTLILLALFLVFAGYVLAQFPSTRGLSSNMTTFALGPLDVMVQGVLGSVPGLMFLAVLFVLLRLALRLVVCFSAVSSAARSMSGRSIRTGRSRPTRSSASWWSGLAWSWPTRTSRAPSRPAFQGISIFAGIVFRSGSSTAIANIVAGYMLIYRRAFKLGDIIKVGEYFGEVTTRRLQVTTLRSPKNEEIIIPNSQLLNTDVLNYSSIGRQQGLILHTDVAIGYSTPWRQVEAILIEAAHRTKGLGAEPRPFVFEKHLGEFAVTYELNVYCTNINAMRALYSALHRNVLDVFNEHGVQIMTPAYEAIPSSRRLSLRKTGSRLRRRLRPENARDRRARKDVHVVSTNPRSEDCRVVAIVAGMGMLVEARVDVKWPSTRTFDFKSVRTWGWHAEKKGEVMMARTVKDDPDAARKRAEPLIIDAGHHGNGQAEDPACAGRSRRYVDLLSAAHHQHVGADCRAVPAGHARVGTAALRCGDAVTEADESRIARLRSRCQRQDCVARRG